MSVQQFILISNYLPDRQESMLRFTDLLANGLRSQGILVDILAPRRILVPQSVSAGKGMWKWLAYVDKWVLFPFALRRAVRQYHSKHGLHLRYHICDHSNAPYLAHLPQHLTAITCHDVLAIRGALGYPDAYCPASRTGKFFQRWIFKHLRQADRIACVSTLTQRHLCELAGDKTPRAGWRIVHNAFNARFTRIDNNEANKILERQNISLPRPFILHVGSNLPRKNRRMLIQMVSQKPNRWSGHICFAGEPIDFALTNEAISCGVADRIYSVPHPDHATLCALYSLAYALVFPSLSEGFGWPLIEAQACGTPVIASHLDPLPEVTGGAAIHADPRNAQSFASALFQLADESIRDALIEKGLTNAKQFEVAAMIKKYLALHDADGMAAVNNSTDTL